ncbi:hypothetical protein SAMN04488577_1063 [Bacillus sp. cl95]|nr:hypothetical protein [Bacillus sp. UNCCL13]SFA78780.1 hypothetical protein SAMN02799634_101789 [Bacillus sp. UNCCL13]SFQ68697.1 hypothetical protein SAMN04488577_1063 [Bacillus sp. cl95]
MDKVVILSPFGYTNFYLCSQFLEKGIETYGFNVSDLSYDSFEEEKLMEIGRNANYIEITREKLLENPSIIDSDIIILSLYDFFISGHEELKDRNLFEFIINVSNRSKQLVVLLPMQMKLKEEKVNLAISVLQELLTRLESSKVNIMQQYYLPTLYGPWQPLPFVFQTLLVSEGKGKRNLSEFKDWTADAIYIEDAIRELMNKIVAEDNGKYLLKSDVPNHWEKCAELLGGYSGNFQSRFPDIEHMLVEEDVQIVTVKSSISLENALDKQKMHTSRLLLGKD